MQIQQQVVLGWHFVSDVGLMDVNQIQTVMLEFGEMFHFSRAQRTSTVVVERLFHHCGFQLGRPGNRRVLKVRKPRLLN
jgi:hypothetical protein